MSFFSRGNHTQGGKERAGEKWEIFGEVKHKKETLRFPRVMTRNQWSEERSHGVSHYIASCLSHSLHINTYKKTGAKSEAAKINTRIQKLFQLSYWLGT